MTPAQRPAVRAGTAAVLALAVALTLGSCTSSGGGTAGPAGPTGGATAAGDLPCEDGTAMERIVRSFLTAYNAGEQRLADRFFAPEGMFQWYSESGRRKGGAARNRSTVNAYLRTRHAEGDQLTLVSLTLSGTGGDFAFSVRRPGTPEPIPAKGALDCDSRRFTVWSVGPDLGP
jgi:hypothetical protein